MSEPALTAVLIPTADCGLGLGALSRAHALSTHYTTARRLLSQVRAVLERERAAITGERRALLDAVHERTEAALGSHRLLVDQGYAEQAAAQARADLDAITQPA